LTEADGMQEKDKESIIDRVVALYAITQTLEEINLLIMFPLPLSKQRRKNLSSYQPH
jgi:hypothetical protein